MDDSLSQTHAARADALATARLFKESEVEFQKALEINPNNSSAHYLYAFTVLLPEKQLDHALEEFHTALSLDPLSLIINVNYAWTLMAAHRYQESLDQFQKVLQRDPSFAPAHFKLSHLYAAMGRYGDAVSEVRITIPDATAVTPDGKGYCQLHQKIADADRDSSMALACVGDRGLALRAMETAYANGDLLQEYIRGPEFDPLRSDPRYIEIMRKMGLPQ